jgi:hypothetical protein
LATLLFSPSAAARNLPFAPYLSSFSLSRESKIKYVSGRHLRKIRAALKTRSDKFCGEKTHNFLSVLNSNMFTFLALAPHCEHVKY